MNGVACGCEQLNRAENANKESIKQDFQTEGQMHIEQWKCPKFCDETHQTREDLPPLYQTAIANFESVIGEKLPHTCPMSCVRNEDVQLAVSICNSAQHGNLSFHQDISTVLFEAQQLVSSEYAKRSNWETKNPEKK